MTAKMGVASFGLGLKRLRPSQDQTLRFVIAWHSDSCGARSLSRIQRLSVSLSVLMAGLLVEQTCGQAPGLAWVTNLGAQVFAVDGQTNVYANAGGTVFVLNGNGLVLQTNGICPIPGIARRYSAGNYYFSGSFDGTQNFVGITLVGGWTNNNGQYSPGWPTCYLAKYAGNGSLQWVTGFGQHATRNRLTGLALDPAGGAYAGYDSSGDGAVVAHL